MPGGGFSRRSGLPMIDISKARKNITMRYEAELQRNCQLFYDATRDCATIVRLLEQKYHPYKIYQWGSLLNPARFNEHSDIDLAIEGITNAEIFFSLLGDAMKLTRFSLDIVQIEKIEPEFADSIRQSGKVVYERP
jgi:predicted nucleotidyltransferase